MLHNAASSSCAAQGIEFDAGFGDAPALALHLLALLGGKSREEGLEGLVALVIPMELAIAAQYQTGSYRDWWRSPRWGTARARTTVVRCARSRWRRAPSSWSWLCASTVGTEQQPRPAHRGERHRRQQFWIVARDRVAHRRSPRRNRTQTRRANAPCGTRAWQPAQCHSRPR